MDATHTNTETTTMTTLTIGTRIYNGGDICNQAHFGTITNVTTDQWGTRYEITPDEGSERTKPYVVSDSQFSPVYKGHGGTRFVTEAAYRTFREAQIAAFNAQFAR